MTDWHRLSVAALVAISVTQPGNALAQDEGELALEDESSGYGSISGNLRLATNYMFRGISQTDDGPQLQGDVTWTHDSGLYVGMWASNTDAGGPGNSVEIDPFIGFSNPIGDSGFTYDLGFWYYAYPGSDFDYDYWEVYGILTYDFETTSVAGAVWYADNYFGEDFFNDVSATAVDVTVTQALPWDLSVSGTLGRQTFDETGGIGDQDYTYYDFGVSKDWNDITLDLRWHDAVGVTSALASSDNVGAVVGSVSFAF
ncbi:conserved hypothetical protein [Parvibaculum lavamentivorans DS-1]|uniref:Porin n=1 Tax=Parvibaculum lavamentivorans (strain DS-1 / DSM 13023 / NCIMB 13966) TaxID=402881 RepID=A7HWC7_PARL1|nr:TorF family putative porin [Parvibaculum lavamentivorans]ABS64210.1 conserved hypothetical protein [Parvibaculum lavamentivorans DS-1]